MRVIKYQVNMRLWYNFLLLLLIIKCGRGRIGTNGGGGGGGRGRGGGGGGGGRESSRSGRGHDGGSGGLGTGWLLDSLWIKFDRDEMDLNCGGGGGGGGGRLVRFTISFCLKLLQNIESGRKCQKQRCNKHNN